MLTKLPSPNDIVLFRKRKESTFGILTDAPTEKVRLFSEEGKELEVDVEKVVFNSGISVEGTLTDAEKKIRLRAMRRELEARKAEVDLCTLWECVEGTKELYSFDELLELYYADEPRPHGDVLLLFWAIDKDDIYFKRQDGGYEVKDSEEVAATIKRKEVEAEKKKERKAALRWARGIMNGETDNTDPEFDPASYIELIKGYVIFLDKFERLSEAKSFISEVGIKDMEGAIEFLMSIGEWSEDNDPLIKRYGIKEEFSRSVLDEACEIARGVPEMAGVTDLTHLEIYSIDDEDTVDIDDAISLEQKDGGYELGIHISNVAALVPQCSLLDEEAARRGETIYLPEKKIHMFPPELVNENLSLYEGKERNALSLIVGFDENLNIKNYRFLQSRIKVKANLSYTAAIEFIDTDETAKKLEQIALNLRDMRNRAGAFILQLPNLKIDVDEDGEIHIRKNYMDTRAHVVVTEFMVLMNYLAGRFFKERRVPAIYRSQPEAVGDDARSMDRADPLFALKVVKHLKPSKTGLDPMPHRSLGVDVYAQITSPIRRYVDLILQRQIVGELTGEGPIYSEQDLETIFPRVELGVKDKKLIERSRVRYWLFKKLRELKGQELTGVVHNISGTRVTVYIKDYLFEVPISLRPGLELAQGDTVSLRIEKVDPLRRRIRLVPLGVSD